MTATALHIDPRKIRYHALIGTGGIGAGSLFLMTGNHTLGREESRGGKYLDARDYCKLHIIAHNVRMLCGDVLPVFPIGKIGDDDVGKKISGEMAEAGLNMDYVHVSPGDKTLFGFCFLYPDGTGGNLTTEESACTKVDPEMIERAEPLFSAYSGNFIALCAPEVPLNSRATLLGLSTKYKGYAVASFTSGEMKDAKQAGMLSKVNLLAMNIDEAAAFAEIDATGMSPERVVDRAIAESERINPSVSLSITAGKNGSWTWDGKQLSHVPAVPVEVKSSAGAGDAHISAIISGLVAGLTLSQSQVLGNLAGALAVTSPHTIHPGMGREVLKELEIRSALKVGPQVQELLSDRVGS